MTWRPAIGALRQRVMLEAPIDTLDDVGGITRSYAPVAQLWARIESSDARAQFVEQRQEQSTTHVVTIRWSADVSSQMRFAYRDRKLLIDTVVDRDETRRFLVCNCREIS